MEEFNVNTFDQDERVEFTEEEVNQLTNVKHDENVKLCDLGAINEIFQNEPIPSPDMKYSYDDRYKNIQSLPKITPTEISISSPFTPSPTPSPSPQPPSSNRPCLLPSPPAFFPASSLSLLTHIHSSSSSNVSSILTTPHHQRHKSLPSIRNVPLLLTVDPPPRMYPVCPSLTPLGHARTHFPYEEQPFRFLRGRREGAENTTA